MARPFFVRTPCAVGAEFVPTRPNSIRRRSGSNNGQIAKFADEHPKAPIMLHFGKLDQHIPKTEHRLGAGGESRGAGLLVRC